MRRVARRRSNLRIEYCNALNATPKGHVNRPQYAQRPSENAFAPEHNPMADMRRVDELEHRAV